MPTFSPPPSSSSYSSVASKRLKQSDSIFDIVLDFRFEKYVTPWIVRITWVVVLVLGAIWLLAQIGGDLGIDINFRSGGEFTYRILQFIQVLFRYAYLFIGLLWIRVMLETMIVIFHIAQSAASIDRKTGN